MIGSGLASAICPPSPSASVTCSVIAAAGLGDVGDARGEHAALAGEVLVDRVGDAVRRQAHVGRQRRMALAHQFFALDQVPQLEAHVVAAVGQARHRAHGQRVGAAAAPFGHGDAAVLVEAAAGIDDAEQAAALQVGAHDGSHRHRRIGLVAEGGDGHRDLVAADAGDLDAELGGGRCGSRSGERADETAAWPGQGRDGRARASDH